MNYRTHILKRKTSYDDAGLGLQAVGQAATDKFLTRFRWMGCNIAVYDVTVQEKADRGGETPCTRRGAKRRGCRGGRRRNRKCRRVVAVDPILESSNLLGGHYGSSLYHQKRIEYRAFYLRTRAEMYTLKLTRAEVRLEKAVAKCSPRNYPRLEASRRLQYRKLVSLVLRLSGSKVYAFGAARAKSLIHSQGGSVKTGNLFDRMELFREFQENGRRGTLAPSAQAIYDKRVTAVPRGGAGSDSRVLHPERINLAPRSESILRKEATSSQPGPKGKGNRHGVGY